MRPGSIGAVWLVRRAGTVAPGGSGELDPTGILPGRRKYRSLRVSSGESAQDHWFGSHTAERGKIPGGPFQLAPVYGDPAIFTESQSARPLPITPTVADWQVCTAPFSCSG